MNERQNMVLATLVAGLILTIVYLCPWRIESTNEIHFSPIYQTPLSYTRSYDTEQASQGSSRIESDEAHIAVGIFAMEILAVTIVGGVLYVVFSDTEDDRKVASKLLS